MNSPHSGRAVLRETVAATVRRELAPPERLSLVEWIETNIRLSTESAAEPGRYYVSRAPYQAGILEAFEDPAIPTVIVEKGAQLGLTLLLTAYICAMVVLQPGPFLIVLPTIEMVRSWFADRFAAMCRDSLVMRDRIRDPRAKDGSTKQHLVGSGFAITGVGANSPASLAGRPERMFIGDDLDRWPPSAGEEGDPWSLASKRLAAFPGSKRIAVSTPTNEGASPIDALYLASDQRVFEVPCSACGAYQRLQWSGIKFDRDADGALVRESVRYACSECGVLHDEGAKRGLLAAGRWTATRPFRGVAGFHISQLYSPWVTWADLVAEFLEAQGNPDKLRVWVNTVLGEVWRPDQEAGDQVDTQALAERRESYGGAEVPAGVGLLTLGADVQQDRIETLVVGWGAAEESWIVRHEVVWGSPADPTTWQGVDRVLRRPWKHAGGATLYVQAAMIDSGYATPSVYRFVAPRQGRHVHASKGSPLMGRPLVTRPKGRPNREGALVWGIGTDTAKDLFYLRLRIAKPGPGYIHFSADLDEEFLAQVTSEAIVRRRVRGREVREYRQLRPRNEALDMLVLNLAALASLGPTTAESLGQFVTRVQELGAPSDTPHKTDDPVAAMMRAARRRTTWVNAWKNDL